MHFDPKFYEARALSYVARTFGAPVRCNILEPDFTKPLDQRPEVDGWLEMGGQLWAIEIKSHPLVKADLERIATRYRHLKYERLKIIAPAIAPWHGNGQIKVECIEYRPELAPIFEFYTTYEPALSPRLEQELESGKHHFRYRMARRARGANVRFRNQTDKRIKSISDLRREITRRMRPDNPPVRIYWSVGRWLSPKDLYFKGRRKLNLYLGGMMVFDIDGPTIHKPMMDCFLPPGGEICPFCFQFSKFHAKRLISFLREKGFREIECVFSGRQGFHIYLFDSPAEEAARRRLVAEIRSARIRIDRPVTAHREGLIAFPTSLHACSMTRSALVEDLDGFSLEMAQEQLSYQI
ncbi:MAG: hypothetical protein ACUVV0_00420 [Anaerolineae bacterium]